MKILKSKKTLSAIVVTLFMEVFLPIKSFAQTNTQGVCGLLPCNFAPVCLGGVDCSGNALSQVGSILEILLSLVFVSIVIYGVWLIVQAALKIIRSEGNEEQIQAGMKLIKGAYVGIILIFVGIIGMVLIFVLFNATDIFKVTPSTDNTDHPGLNLQ